MHALQTHSASSHRLVLCSLSYMTPCYTLMLAGKKGQIFKTLVSPKHMGNIFILLTARIVSHQHPVKLLAAQSPRAKSCAVEAKHLPSSSLHRCLWIRPVPQGTQMQQLPAAKAPSLNSLHPSATATAQVLPHDNTMKDCSTQPVHAEYPSDPSTIC